MRSSPAPTRRAKTSERGGPPGWTVSADYNGNCVQDPLEPSAVTDANGDYLITHVVPNTSANPYVVRDVSQAGWTCSAPAGCAHTNFINNGLNVSGMDFGA